MKLYSYCIPVDDGAAPNPYWGTCTLVICKPVIRRVAQEGDWIVGVGSKNVNGKDYSGKLVYAMRVSQKMSMKKYDRYCKTSLMEKIPDIASADYRRRVGDCIYDYNDGNEPTLRLGVHTKDNVDRDLRGEYALLSDHFYYFGRNAIDIPEQFKVIARQGQGHQSIKNQFIKYEFVNWLQANHQRNCLLGDPQIEIKFETDSTGLMCANIRCQSADDDESEDYSDEEMPLSHWSYFLALENDLKSISRHIEIHPANFKTFSISLTQLFMAACSEIDIVLKNICWLLEGKKYSNMGDYSTVIQNKFPALATKKTTVPRYNIELVPFADWQSNKLLSWWDSYNKVKHNRNTHYQEANLENTLQALGGLHILTFNLIRIHKGKMDGGFESWFVFKHLQPKQELFLFEKEDMMRDVAEGRKTFP